MQRKTLVLLVVVLALALLAMPALGAYTFEQLPNGKFAVSFTYPSAASEVYLVGDFNNWENSNPDHLMEKNTEGVYEKTIELAKGTYEYKFFADGEWKSDPENPDVVPGFGNSLAIITAGSIKGELAIKGEMNNEVKQVNQGAIAFNNDLTLKVEGTLQEEKDEVTTDRLDFMAEIKVDNNVKDIENATSEQDYHILDRIYLNTFDTTLLQKYANTSVQGNLTDDTDSFDYLKLIDVQTSKDDRDNFNINESGDNIRIKITPGSETPSDWDYYINFTKYTSDITKATSTKKYYSSLNAKKGFHHSLTGERMGEIGVTGLFYQPVVLSEVKDLAISGAVFGEYEIIDNLTLRGEYAHLATGDINESITGAYDRGDHWLFVFNVEEYPDIEDIKPFTDIEEVHVVGDFKSGARNWDPADKHFAMEEVEEGIWEVKVPKDAIDEGKGYKFIFDGDSWAIGHECGQNGHVGSGGSDLIVGQTAEDIPIKQNGQAYLAEVNYRIFDPRRSFRVGGEAYKFDITAGFKVLSNGTYLPVASQDLYKTKGTGFNKAYFGTYLYPLDNDLKLTLAGDYSTFYKETDKSSYGVDLGFDFPQPISYLDYVKGNLGRRDLTKAETEDNRWVFEKQDLLNENEVRAYNRVFLEGKSKPLSWFNYVLGNVEFIDKIKDTGYVKLFGETELLIPVDQIAYLKGNVDYILGDPGTDVPEDEERAPRFWIEGKVHHLPYVQDYLTHILVNYESDKGQIKDHSWYGDDDNDWEQKLYGETKFVLPQLEGFQLVIAAESQKVEEGKFDAEQAIDKDAKFYVADEKAFIDWYTFMKFTAGYEFNFGLRADLTLIYDLSHHEISQYEDDAIKVELTQAVSDYSSLKASYNAKHPDHSSNECISLKLQTLF
ncbi:MAG TPA: hypothetical protein DD734_05000 [Firmicutes bacterium]|nr:hypothetical protein [Bacillota bacterium]HBR33971.1 hypothetical protein [Bacillota bacterium]